MNIISRRILVLFALVLAACGDFHGPWEYYPEEREIYTGIFTYGYILSDGGTDICFSKIYELDETASRNFAFYDSVTTHDSSLSMATFSILASEIGEVQKAYDYFMSSARLDLDDIHRNTKDGLHMANMAGTVNGIIRGFGGMRIRDGELCFAPVCPPWWRGYAFRVQFRGRVIQVQVSRDGGEYCLLQGEPLGIRVSGEKMTLR